MATSTLDWEKKWKLMIDRDNNKKLQNEILNEKLREKKELEEAIECTFHPKILRTYGSDYIVKRSKEELLQLLLPIISEEESILMELRQVELDENNKQELKDIISSATLKFPTQSMDYLLNFYRDERLKDISNAKNLKLEIVGKLQELERKFNILCSNERIDSSDLKRVGFDIENCKNIKNEILKSIDSYDTLKNRHKVSREFEEIIRQIEHKRAHQPFNSNDNNPFIGPKQNLTNQAPNRTNQYINGSNNQSFNHQPLGYSFKPNYSPYNANSHTNTFIYPPNYSYNTRFYDPNMDLRSHGHLTPTHSNNPYIYRQY